MIVSRLCNLSHPLLAAELHLSCYAHGRRCIKKEFDNQVGFQRRHILDHIGDSFVSPKCCTRVTCFVSRTFYGEMGEGKSCESDQPQPSFLGKWIAGGWFYT